MSYESKFKVSSNNTGVLPVAQTTYAGISRNHPDHSFPVQSYTIPIIGNMRLSELSSKLFSEIRPIKDGVSRLKAHYHDYYFHETSPNMIATSCFCARSSNLRNLSRVPCILRTMATTITPNEPSLGSSQPYEVVVRPADLANEIASDTTSDPFPRVLATSWLIAFMEIAPARIMQPCLGPGQLSVGARLDVTHTTPTPVGSKLTAATKFLGKEKKLYLFEMSARDEGGEIGRGTHARAIIDAARLGDGAQRRLQAPAV